MDNRAQSNVCLISELLTLSRSLSVLYYCLLIQEIEEANTKECTPFVSALQLVVGL